MKVKISDCPTIGIFENIMGFNPIISSKLVTQTHLLTWLLKRIQAKSHDENRAYAAELLSILLQNRNENRLVLSENDGIEIILKVLSVISISNQLQNHHA
jgi:beta-catenin-like protein 1